MRIAPAPEPLVEVCVKNLVPVLCATLVMASTARADEQGQTEQQQQSSTSSSSSTSATAATATKAGAKKDEKKDEKGNNPLANAVQARTPEEQALQSGFQLITVLDTYLGMGTFVDAKQYSYLASSLSVIPQYLFGIGKQRLVASASFRGVYEFTMPDVETGRRYTFWDTRIGVSAPALWRDKKFTDIAFSPSLGLTIPMSPESFNAGMITMLNVGLTMSRRAGPVDFRANIGGSRGFFGQPFNGPRNPTLNGGSIPTDANGNAKLICRPGEDFCGFSNWNTAWMLSAGGQVQWRATGSLLFYVGYTYIKMWREAATFTPDQYTPQALDGDGNPVAKTGYGEFDRTSAFFGASYQLSDHYSLDLYAFTIQTPLTATGQVRFPFLSFGAWADNATSLTFSLTAAY
jgi:hypothetical protein